MQMRCCSNATRRFSGIWRTLLANIKRLCLILPKKRTAMKQTVQQKDLPSYSAPVFHRSSPLRKAMPGWLHPIILSSMFLRFVPAMMCRCWSSGCTSLLLWGCSVRTCLRACAWVTHQRNVVSAANGSWPPMQGIPNTAADMRRGTSCTAPVGRSAIWKAEPRENLRMIIRWNRYMRSGWTP